MNIKKTIQIIILSSLCLLGLTACDPQVYGSVGVSSGWGGYGGGGYGSVSVGGRIR